MPNATNLLMGPGTLYIADLGEIEPTNANVGDPPGANYTDLGATLGGLTFNSNQTITDLTVDQIPDPIDARMTARMFTLVTQLAEITISNLARAWNLAEPVPDVGFTVLEPPSDTASMRLTPRSLLFDGHAPGGFRRRVIARKVLSVENVGTASQKDGQTVLPVTFKCYWVSDAIRPLKVVDETT